MKRFTIQEFAEICGGISYNGADKKIDGLIKKVNEGKLTGEIERNDELIDGKLTKVVLVSEDLLNLVKKDKSESNSTKFNQVKSENIELNVTKSKYDNELNNSQYNSNERLNNNYSPLFIENIVNELISTQKQLTNYAEQAGQVKLLTDNNKFYQDEYFKQKYENDRLKDELKKVKEEFENYKKNSFKKPWKN